MNTKQIKKLLVDKTQCELQKGWPCGTCFFGISDQLTNSNWQLLLLMRKSYKEEELGNLPSNREEALQEIVVACEGNK